MAGVPTSTTSLATNSASLDALRQSAARDPKAAIKETSKQLESLFMNELMKSMRSTTMSSGLFDNSGTEMGTQMLDQQYATQLSGLPGGLADLIARQLEKQMGGASASSVPATPGKLPAAAGTKPHIPQKAYAEDFVRSHTQAADAAAAETGIPSSFILSQAALESGWGRKEIRNADGSTSYNVFGIKASSDWKGPTTQVVTTEYVNGQPRKVTQSFRAYASYEDAFRDWARMLKQSPRYAAVVERSAGGSAQAFAQGLQRAGYATDPQYADKLGRVINTTLRLQRSMNA
ncbi:MAG TPA: flagellar assembly peptidoglycan hydrolase FlgJ [Burkholderiaceae bacterium]|nr:flagellar assembly peptidoglycan hydrolase FlgJ [Burkholderiaceae bacterium]